MGKLFLFQTMERVEDISKDLETFEHVDICEDTKETIREVIRHLDNYTDLLNLLEELREAIDKTIKYTTPYDTMNHEKWENLERYNLDSIFKFIDELE